MSKSNGYNACGAPDGIPKTLQGNCPTDKYRGARLFPPEPDGSNWMYSIQTARGFTYRRFDTEAQAWGEYLRVIGRLPVKSEQAAVSSTWIDDTYIAEIRSTCDRIKELAKAVTYANEQDKTYLQGIRGNAYKIQLMLKPKP